MTTKRDLDAAAAFICDDSGDKTIAAPDAHSRLCQLVADLEVLSKGVEDSGGGAHQHAHVCAVRIRVALRKVGPPYYAEDTGAEQEQETIECPCCGAQTAAVMDECCSRCHPAFQGRME